MNPIRVIIADDHRMVREGIKQLLELDGDIEIIGQADDGYQCLSLIERLHPDVCLVDINMPKMNGLELVAKLRAEMNDQKILMLTIHNEVEYLMKSLDIGVNGYILKDSDSATLKNAIVAVYSGDKYIEPSMSLAMKDKLHKVSFSGSDDDLTRREIEVLCLLAEGLFNKEIAFKLSISEKTVKNHVSNIFKKIGVSDRTQAAIYAIKNNYIDVG